MLHRHVRFAVSIAALATLAACKNNQSNATDSANGTIAPAPDTTAMAAPMSGAGASASAMGSANMAPAGDAKIVSDLLGGDSAEVILGKMAETKTKNASVKSFAAMLVSDHSKNATTMSTLATKLSLQAMPSGDKVSDANNESSTLQGLSGTAFDTAYVNAMVSDHQKDIDDTKQAQSNATSAQLKTELTKTIAVMQRHLDRAKELQAKLPKGK